ncbi:MAG: hypothetical protein OIF50_05700, partial [Flavobacteriaceae bacterium]|nr:hypothetical protein [Flavobacteriaceae bacterium]
LANAGGGLENFVAIDGKVIRTSTIVSSTMDQASTLGEVFGGQISEFIIYDQANDLDGTHQKRIQSYLAIKYGITLDQTTATHYIASDGTTLIWDTSALHASSYDAEIFGIGKDTGSGLDQRVSKSQSSGSIVSIALDANFTAANNDAARTTTHTNNLQFLVMGSNGASTSTNYNPVEITAAMGNERIDREWQVQATNFNQSVALQFEGFDQTWHVYSSDNPDFTVGTVTDLGALNAQGIIAGLTLTDGAILTLAREIFAPGAISQGLEVWLKADEITAAVADTNVETWTNQALGNAAATAPTQTTVNSRPIFRAGSHSSAINFNPTLSFDATDDKFDFSDLDVGNYQVFAVANKTDITQTGNLINLAGTGKHDIYLTNGGLKSANKGVS